MRVADHSPTFPDRPLQPLSLKSTQGQPIQTSSTEISGDGGYLSVSGKGPSRGRGGARGPRGPRKCALTYQSWSGAINRCTCPSSQSWGRYGGRGIKFAAVWGDYYRFVADVGERPSRAHSIDRIDNDGNYEPGNVRWATRIEQSRNTSANRMFEFRGAQRCLAEIAEITGCDYSTMHKRLNAGWDIEGAIIPEDPMVVAAGVTRAADGFLTGVQAAIVGMQRFKATLPAGHLANLVLEAA